MDTYAEQMPQLHGMGEPVFQGWAWLHAKVEMDLQLPCIL